MHRHAQEIQRQDDPGQRRADAPEDVADDQRPQLVVLVRERFGDRGARGGGDDDGDDGDQVQRRHLLELASLV